MKSVFDSFGCTHANAGPADPNLDADNPATAGPVTKYPVQLPDGTWEDEAVTAPSDPLPIPRGVILLYQPLTAESAVQTYTNLTEGECENCGAEAKHHRVSIEIKPDGIGVFCQCKTCGAEAVLAVAYSVRRNPSK